MTTTQKIFIGVLVLVVIAIIIVVINYYSKKGPEVATTTSYSQTSGLSSLGAGGISGIAGIIGALSDARFKEGVERISKNGYGDAYNQIRTMSPVYYMYKDAAGMNVCDRTGCGTKKIGFIAQDLEKVNPNLVFKDKNGVRYIDVMQMVALNTAAMKKMQEDLEYTKGLIKSNPVYGGSVYP